MSAAAQMSATVTLSKPRSANSASATSTVSARLAARLRSRSPSTDRHLPLACTHSVPRVAEDTGSTRRWCGIVCLVAHCATYFPNPPPGATMSPSASTTAAVLDPASTDPDDGWQPQQIAALAVVA